MSPELPAVAMMLCVRNQAELLRLNLAYHERLGVRRAYVFLDRCTDGTEEVARSFPWVQAIEDPFRPEERFLSVHQMRCMERGLQMARREGFDWLLHLDDDEFARGEDRLPPLLASLPREVEQVILPPAEVVPQVLPEGAPFWRQVHFVIRGVLRRPMLDPGAGVVRILGGWIGHDKGKSLARTAAHLEPVSPHFWRRTGGGDAVTVRRGRLYHYVVTGPADWLARHRLHAEYPDHWRNGRPVRFPKQAWREASLRFSPEEARAYYDRWVAVSRWRIAWGMATGRVVRDTFVARRLDDMLRSALPARRPPG